MSTLIRKFRKCIYMSISIMEISIAKQGLYDGLMQYLVFDKNTGFTYCYNGACIFLFVFIPKLFNSIQSSFLSFFSFIYTKNLFDVCSKLISTLISLLILSSVTYSLIKKKKDFLDLQLNISEEFDNL